MAKTDVVYGIDDMLTNISNNFISFVIVMR